MNIFTLESRSDLQKIDSNWENFVAEICNIRQFPMANCLGYGMKMVPKMPGMSFSLFVVNYQVYPHPNLARIWSGTTKTGRTLLQRFVTSDNFLWRTVWDMGWKWYLKCPECHFHYLWSTIRYILIQIWRGFDRVQRKLGELCCTDL